MGSCVEATAHSDKGAQATVEFEPSKTTGVPDDNGIVYELPYDLDDVSNVCNLPPELLEISGLGYNQKLNMHVSINDEKAILFMIDLSKCEISDKFNFGSKGDYEGIESVGNTVYILKSNGNLYPFDIEAQQARKPIKTPLSLTNDVEGLGYDADHRQLIFACKGSPNVKDHDRLKHSKAFYVYDIDTDKFHEEPKFIIKDKALKEFVQSRHSGLSKSKLKKLHGRIKEFSPSAIAKHPLDKYFYILSSVGRSLVICEDDGAIIDVVFLDPNKYSQPEGITFDATGKMYISNEGRSLVAKIYTFDYRK